MSAWFVYALLSTAFAGIWAFGQKASVHKGYDTVLQSALSGLLAALFAFALFPFAPSIPGSIPGWFYWLCILSGLLYILSSIARLEALKFMDSTIHFPLYKVIGPALVAAIGIGLLGDNVSQAGMIGIVLSCLVPVLLISRSENHRQKNLKLGIVFTLIATVLAAGTAGLNAFIVADTAYLVIPVVVVSCFFGSLFGLGLFLRRHKMSEMRAAVVSNLTLPFVLTATITGVSMSLSSFFLLLAIAQNDVSLVYSINAHYILVPVILSVWMYKEHWNLQKGLALAISILSLVLLHQ